MVQTALGPTGRRLEILRRAADVFRRKGYHGAGMREIAEGLGLAPGALYYYFPSKDDLLFSVQDGTLRRLLAGARRIAASGGTAAERLRALVAFHLEQTLEEMGGTAAHVEFRALPPARWREVVRRRDAYEGVVRRVVRAGAKDGSLRPVDARLATWALLGALNWTVVWWRPEGRWSAADLARAFGDLFLGGLEARVGGPEGAR
jgi:TetR/AcrR family transcriptional regulator